MKAKNQESLSKVVINWYIPTYGKLGNNGR